MRKTMLTRQPTPGAGGRMSAVSVRAWVWRMTTDLQRSSECGGLYARTGDVRRMSFSRFWPNRARCTPVPWLNLPVCVGTVG